MNNNKIIKIKQWSNLQLTNKIIKTTNKWPINSYRRSANSYKWNTKAENRRYKNWENKDNKRERSSRCNKSSFRNRYKHRRKESNNKNINNISKTKKSKSSGRSNKNNLKWGQTISIYIDLRYRLIYLEISWMAAIIQRQKVQKIKDFDSLSNYP